MFTQLKQEYCNTCYAHLHKVISGKVARPLTLRDAIYEDPSVLNTYECERRMNEVLKTLTQQEFDYLLVLWTYPRRFQRMVERIQIDVYLEMLNEHRVKKIIAVCRIQRGFLKSYYNPEYTLCKRRLIRQFNDCIHEFNAYKKLKTL